MNIDERELTSGGALDVGANVYRQMVESVGDFAMIATTLDGRITAWNTGATNILGYSRHEIIGQNLSVIFPFDDQLRGAQLSEMRVALYDGKAEGNHWCVRKDGVQVWTSGLLTPLRGESGQIDGFVKIMRDRTEARKEERAIRADEERARFILTSAVDYAIFTFDESGRILSWNAGAGRIFGYDGAEVLGRDARLLLPCEGIEGALEGEMAAVRRLGRAENERLHLRKDGSQFWGSGLTMPLCTDRHNPGYLTILRDGTDRHQADQHQQVMMREMSHRVKNRLTLVTSMLSLQARSTHIADLKRALMDAETRVATIAALHDHLWRQPKLETVDLSDFLNGLCHRLAQTSSRHAVALEATTCSIDTDRAIQIALLVNELVTNAFKHAYPAGGGRVDVEVYSADDTIVLKVSDQGVGLPGGFDLLQDSCSSLGMRIVRGLTKQLNAKISVETAAAGASFTLSIPIASQRL
ncbi:PAS domain S-box protein [Rhizobium sp. L245/93]|uniref:sensor histidine kinase n=1 Tax=Rhizobium sp. L245/93 TaxID=2819998 RepID=UPI001ADAD62F|nr:PAS domain S-box protein [Rhizobium sp. L245/93]MBO9171912.1 PAS domain S-box protein [Rhizobium sp. L245/93]